MPNGKVLYAVLCCGLITLYGGSVQASSYLKSNEVFCDTTKTLCIKGSLSVHPNDGVARLRARVYKKTRPGFIRITLYGYKKKSHSIAYIQGRIEGKHSEIVDLKNGLSVNSDTRWVLHRFEYLATQ